jgi:hypothetical protein
MKASFLGNLSTSCFMKSFQTVKLNWLYPRSPTKPLLFSTNPCNHKTSSPFGRAPSAASGVAPAGAPRIVLSGAESPGRSQKTWLRRLRPAPHGGLQVLPPREHEKRPAGWRRRGASKWEEARLADGRWRGVDERQEVQWRAARPAWAPTSTGNR